MAQRQTEQLHADAKEIDLRSDLDIASLLARGQADAAASVEQAISTIAQAGALAANAVGNGGRLIYAAAGSSGLMALADSLELPGTYGISSNQIVVLMAGGAEALVNMRGGPEDDGAAAREAVLALNPGPNDCLIALTASGSTPYPIEAVRAARAQGAATVGISNNAGAAIFDGVDVAVHLPTPAEVIAGSTRMGAGTAQKIALNMISTIMAVRLGHVHDGYMVNVVADNDKLRDRARGMVAAIAEVSVEKAGEALGLTDGAVKAAILVAKGADTDRAAQLLAQHNGFLRPALAELAAAQT
ncbi:MAG: N-acetylmuramic acid 6-phosphate etherase [Phyllobacteriaceae bacterium]|nr:N-acetylmuramic acid 6-phosphate etherase [Phyllobacteriaceae bacterium]